MNVPLDPSNPDDCPDVCPECTTSLAIEKSLVSDLYFRSVFFYDEIQYASPSMHGYTLD